MESVTERFLKAAQEMLWSCMRVLEQCLNHCSTSNTTPSSYDVTASAINKEKKRQRLADPLLQSGVVTRSNRV